MVPNKNIKHTYKHDKNLSESVEIAEKKSLIYTVYTGNYVSSLSIKMNILHFM